jgi:YggT family protein
MGSDYLSNPMVFIVDVIFGLYILAIMLRFILQWLRANFYSNPVAQALIKITNPPLTPLRRVIPGYGGVDFAAIVLMLALQLIAQALIFFIKGANINFAMLFFASLAELLSLFINVFIFGIFIQVIVSWINPGTYNPAVALVYSLTEPVLRPARQLIRPIGGLDLSPLIALLVLQVAKMLVIPPIYAIGANLAG